MRTKIVIWGLGKEYNAHLNLLKMYEYNQKIEVVAVTAKEILPYKYLDQWPIISSSELSRIEFDYVLVFNEKFFGDIVMQIQELKIEREKVLPGRIIDIPYFDWDKYIELYRSKVSIITNNCLGGILYRTLGMECRSPFKNLWVYPQELCEHFHILKKWIAEEPSFVRWNEDIHSHDIYPVGQIDGMEIHFNHDTNWKDAIDKWKKGVRKINYDNLFLAIYAERKEIVDTFLDTVSKGTEVNGVCFIPEHIEGYDDNERVYKLKLLPGQKEFYETVNSNVSNSKNCLVYELLSMFENRRKYRCMD